MAPNAAIRQHRTFTAVVSRSAKFIQGAVIPKLLRSSQSFEDAQRSAGDPGICPSAMRPLCGPRDLN
jgi:hypothetical protein